ncbi:MAG: 7-carboxy-7-deazaguanine synthase QueE [Geobacteraceae bacterium]
MNKHTTNMIEIFSSIQGEGKFIGLRQMFLRLHGCSMDCSYCDSRVTRSAAVPEFCQAETTPGRQVFELIKNPVSLDYLNNLLTSWVSLRPNAHHSISITGGEPLLHAEALQVWLPELRKILPIYLETNGIHFQELSQCIDYLDYISMDIKLPSITKSRDFWEEHRAFLQIAAEKDVYVKIVISEETSIREIQKACEVVVSVNKNIPLILQPLTTADVSKPISSNILFELQEEASNYVDEVRIIPQTHKYLHLL